MTNRHDEESIRKILLVMLAVPGTLWATSCLFLVFIGRGSYCTTAETG